MLALVVLSVGCAKAQARPPPQPARPALHHGPLTDYVPAAGLRWLVVAKPRALLENPVTRSAIEGIVSKARLDAFEAASGVDLRRVSDAAVAGFDYSTLYLATLPSGGAGLATARFSERLVAGAIDKQPHPGIRRISGVVGQTPETLLTLDDATLAVTVGDPTPSRIVEAFARGRIKSSPSALRGSALREMPNLAATSPLAAFAAGPFPEDWQRAAGGIFESAVACAVAVRPLEAGRLNVRFVVLGDFEQDPERAGALLKGAWLSLAESSTGRLLGLNQAEQPQLKAEPNALALELTLPVDPLVHGLRAAVLADVAEILRIRPSQEPSQSPPPSP